LVGWNQSHPFLVGIEATLFWSQLELHFFIGNGAALFWSELPFLVGTGAGLFWSELEPPFFGQNRSRPFLVEAALFWWVPP